jgi:hypothetical protein
MSLEVYEVIPSGILGGQFAQCVLHVEVDETTVQNAYIVAKSLADEFNGLPKFVGLWCNMLPADYLMTSLRVRKLASTGGATAVIAGGALASNTGQRAGSISSAQVSPLIIWVPITDPQDTGRTFLPGISEDDIDDMQIVTGLLDEINDFVDYWKGGGTLVTPAFTWSGCIYRRASQIGDAIQAGYVSPLIGTQRRRLRPV